MKATINTFVHRHVFNQTPSTVFRKCIEIKSFLDLTFIIFWNQSLNQHVQWKNGFLKGSGINYCECNLNFYRSIVYFHAIGTTVNNRNNLSFIKLVPTVKATSVSCSYKLKLELLKVSVTVCMEKSRKTVKSSTKDENPKNGNRVKQSVNLQYFA